MRTASAVTVSAGEDDDAEDDERGPRQRSRRERRPKVSQTDVDRRLAAAVSDVDRRPGDPHFYRSIAAGSNGMTRAFGVEGVNRNGTGPCVEVMTVLPPKPDLVVRSPSVSASSLETGESFTLSVTVGNDGAGNAAWRPLLLYYRSTDGGTITGNSSDGDTEEGDERTDEEKEIGALFAGDTRSHSISLTAPSAAGTYYYGACVSGYASLESDGTNNCSGSVAVVVSN